MRESEISGFKFSDVRLINATVPYGDLHFKRNTLLSKNEFIIVYFYNNRIFFYGYFYILHPKIWEQNYIIYNIFFI